MKVIRSMIQLRNEDCRFLLIMIVLVSCFSATSVWAILPNLTYVEGNIIDATWTLADSPYIVTNNIMVSGRLNIEAGVEVHLAGNYRIEVEPNALLIAEGGELEAERILFTSASNMWQGIYFDSANEGSLIQNCDIFNAGTAISCGETDMEITGCKIEANNTAIACWEASPHIHDNPVIKVTGQTDLPADYHTIGLRGESNPVIANNDRIECSVGLNGRATGILISNCSPTIEKNWIEVSSLRNAKGIDIENANDASITRNVIRVRATSSSRGLNLETSFGIDIINNTIIFYDERNNITGLRVGSASSLVTLINNIIMGTNPDSGIGLIAQNESLGDESGYNLIHLFHSTYGPGFNERQGDIFEDPMFVTQDAEADSAYRLFWSEDSVSPCINAGYEGEDWYDEDGTRADIGCYPYNFGDNSVSENLTVNPNGFQLYSAYPNPFNNSTSVSFFLPIQSKVNIVVYDLTGKRVEKLTSGELSSGLHNFNWQVAGLAAGSYIVHLDSEGVSKSLKLVYLP